LKPSLLQVLRRGGPGLFISGTDTGVGKTWVACRLAEWGHAQGWRMGVLKPAESGGGGDARALIRASGSQLPLDLVRPYAFRLPLAPAVAAAAEGRRVALAPIRRAFKSVAARSDWTLVEGAGGLLVPYAPGWDGAGLAKRLGLPVLLVARAGLGTINHSLLSVEAARRRGLTVLGVLLNGRVKPGDRSSATNADQISTLGRVRVWGPAPWGLRDWSVWNQA
jgi:dethiobiotin synthetase